MTLEVPEEGSGAGLLRPDDNEVEWLRRGTAHTSSDYTATGLDPPAMPRTGAMAQARGSDVTEAPPGSFDRHLPVGGQGVHCGSARTAVTNRPAPWPFRPPGPRSAAGGSDPGHLCSDRPIRRRARPADLARHHRRRTPQRQQGFSDLDGVEPQGSSSLCSAQRTPRPRSEAKSLILRSVDCCLNSHEGW